MKIRFCPSLDRFPDAPPGPLGLWKTYLSFEKCERVVVFATKRCLILLVIVTIAVYLGFVAHGVVKESRRGYPSSITFLDYAVPIQWPKLARKQQSDLLRAASVAASERRIGLAIVLIQQAIATSRSDANADMYFDLGNLLYLAASPRTSFDCFREGIRRGLPSDPLLIKALSCARQQEYHAFVIELADAVLAPDHASRLSEEMRMEFTAAKSRALLDSKQYQEALAWCQAQDPKSLVPGESAAIQATALLRLGRNEEAADLLSNFLGPFRNGQGNLDAKLALRAAVLYGEMGQWSEAEKLLSALSKFSQAVPERMIQIIAASSGAPAEFRRSLIDRFLDNTQRPEAIFQLACLLASHGDVDSIKHIVSRTTGSRPDSLLASLALAFAVDGDIHSARETLVSLELAEIDNPHQLVPDPERHGSAPLNREQTWVQFVKLLVADLEIGARVTPLTSFMADRYFGPDIYEIAIRVLEKNDRAATAAEIARIARQLFPFNPSFEESKAGLRIPAPAGASQDTLSAVAP